MDEPWQAEIGDFCARLRQLRIESGNPTLEWLSGHPLCPKKSQLSKIFRGQVRRLPDADTVRGIVMRCAQWARQHGRQPLLPLDERPWLIERDLVERRMDSAGTTNRRPAAATDVVPFQLPADTVRFTGRTEQLGRLLELNPDLPGDPTVVVTAVAGMAGIGKTALAVHAAHRLADRFPDGVLFTDLRGFTPDAEPTPPGQALDYLLRALGVPGARIPQDLDARVGLYRSVLARRKVLLVLDNAAHESQLQPLLPSAPCCRVIVTSRRQLAALDDATHLVLPVLAPDEAAGLFRSLAGDQVGPDDDDIVDRIVALCGHLPLAIRIAAARLRLAPVGTPATLHAELDDAIESGRRLEWLSDGHRAVGAALSVSYRQLTAEQQHAFRLVGLHPGTDVEPYALAALAGTTADRARQLLDDLHAASLLDQPAHRRYAPHDLVAAYATTLAADLPERDRDTSLDRLYDHYAATSSLAMDLAYPWESDQRPRPPATRTPTPGLTGEQQAQSWLKLETDNLLAAAHHAVQRRIDHVLHQSTTLRRHLRASGLQKQATSLHEQALAAARRHDRRAAEREVLCALGDAYYSQGRLAAAEECFEQVVRNAGSAQGNHKSTSDALRGLGDVHFMRGEHDEALDCFQRALSAARELGDRTAELDALRGVGITYQVQARYDLAIDCGREGLTIARQTGDRNAEQVALRVIGDVHHMEGRYEQAVDCFEQSLAIARETENRGAQNYALGGLGILYCTQGRYGASIDCLQEALAFSRQTGNRSEEQGSLRSLGEAYRLQGQYALASDCLEQALAMARETDYRNGQFEAHHSLGRLHHATGNYDEALRHEEIALRLASDLHQPDDQARAHDGLAHAHLALADPGQARHHWQSALEVLTSTGSERTEEATVSTDAIRARLQKLDSPARTTTSRGPGVT